MKIRIILLAVLAFLNSQSLCNADNDMLMNKEKDMKIIIQSGNIKLIYGLNNSQAAKDLYEQLPLSIKVENYSNNEKIFYPLNKLNTKTTSLANAKKGTLAYYAPWGNVVMFYKDFGSGQGLYELGEIVSGIDDIEKLTGTIEVKIHE